MHELLVDGRAVRITNPEKVLWPDAGIRKIDYLHQLIQLSPFMLAQGGERLLTALRFPDGVNGKSFFQKNTPACAPDYIRRVKWQGNRYTVMDSRAALLWLGNQGVIEFHTSFNVVHQPDHPVALVFDLDPAADQPFEAAAEAALRIHETLTTLQIQSYAKTSGATGLQIYIPIHGRYTYEEARRINAFFGRYFAEKYPALITIERLVHKRGTKLYFDYLQMWRGRTITMPYSPRATAQATLSMPVRWNEIAAGIHPQDFTLQNAILRLGTTGDLFAPLLDPAAAQILDELLRHA